MKHNIPLKANTLPWPLMKNNITPEDRDQLIAFLKESPVLTQSGNVAAFEREWCEWLGARHGVFVNSGSSANLITLAVLRERFGTGEVIVPALTWPSDVVAVLQNGFTPVFVDIHPRTLGLDPEATIARITPRTRAVFLTHTLGFNALGKHLLEHLRQRHIPLLEDTCESYGAQFQGRKLGTFGLMSNFSFYYAHHMTTVEGGMVCTDDPDLYELLRMYRSHGLVRESLSEAVKQSYREDYPDLNPEFVFAVPGFNVRSTEINAVLGRCQLKRLDANIRKRNQNLSLFLARLDPEMYRTDFEIAGASNYALTLILKRPDPELASRVMDLFREEGVEFRRGTAGGGNQLRQPYLKRFVQGIRHEDFPETEHVHFFGFYIGNYPDLEARRIEKLCEALNALKKGPVVSCRHFAAS